MKTVKTVAYVAPATASSTVLVLVKPDNTTMKPVVAIVITTSLAVKLLTKLQMMTGIKSRTMMNGAIRILAARVIDDAGNM